MRGQAGFTIVEVTLFLGITGLLLFMVMTGFGGTIQSNRVTDTNRSFEAAIEAEFSDVRSGTFTRASNDSCIAPLPAETPGASNSCLSIGKLLVFKAGGSGISSYNIVADIAPTTSCSEVGAMVLECYNPRVINTANPVSTITPQWAATIARVTFQHKTISAATMTATSIAVMRDPVLETIYVVPNNTAVPGNGVYPVFTSIPNDNYINTQGQICIRHDTFPARIGYTHFTGGAGSGTIVQSMQPLKAGWAC